VFKFRGVNIYPSTIDAILSSIPGLGSEYQIHLTRDAGHRDHMRLVAERGEGVERGRGEELQREIVYAIKHKVMVTAAVEVVDYGSLPRSERKTKRVFDTRIQDSII
jgi:phenylacetate-coenzyme A ligase PaaK-like adenylate-forming protein